MSNGKLKCSGLFLILAAVLFAPSLLKSQASLDATLSVNQVDGIYIPFQNNMPVPSFEKQKRQTISLKGTWKKQRFTPVTSLTLAKRSSGGFVSIINEAQNRHLSAYDDSKWDSKEIPSVENIMKAYPNVPENYESGVWYRYRFTIPNSTRDQFVKLIFQSVNYVADVWLNDTYLGYHEGGYTQFAFDVTGSLNFSAENVLAVRVDNPAWGTRNDIVPFYRCDWFNYTGIIGDVYLETSNPASVVRADVLPLDSDGNIQATLTLLNRSTSDKSLTASVSFYNADVNSSNIKTERADSLIGEAAKVEGNTEFDFSIAKDSAKVLRTNLLISAPRLWSMKSPNLYIMKVMLKENNIVIDEFNTQFGIRSVKTLGDKIVLNNTPVFFTGTARHEDHPLYGRSIPKDIIFSDLQKVKGINANMLRTAHYPNNLYTYLIADRLGIAITEEIPVWWFDDATVWSIQNTTRHIHEQMFKEMFFRDFNRPSILFWSTSNECKDETGRLLFVNTLKQEIEKFPDGRLLTQSAAADRPGFNDRSQKICDIAGWTMYFGIFQGDTQNKKYYEGTYNFLVNAKGNNPGKPILNTEYGLWSGESGYYETEQKTAFSETFRALKQFAPVNPDGSYNPQGPLAGITWWCIFDWYTCQQISANGYQSMVLYKMDSTTPKPVLSLLKSSYAPYFALGGNPSTGIEEDKHSSNPAGFILEQNYPNPFNPSTTLKFSLPEDSHVRLSVYNLLGEEIKVLLDEVKTSGSYMLNVSCGMLPSGIYFCRMSAGINSKTIKMNLIR
ncbi:MAG: glycoside hydrolase family 2 TIM barrel-domain containing protein [Clostridiales bacterium]